ncbi:hypothetical protein Tco_1272876 [Tanacetum coccineum]
MPLYSQLEGTGSSVGTVEGSAGARCSSSSSSSSSFSTSSSLSSSDDYYHNCLIRWQDGQQDPPQGPLHPLWIEVSMFAGDWAVGEAISMIEVDPYWSLSALFFFIKRAHWLFYGSELNMEQICRLVVLENGYSPAKTFDLVLYNLGS